MKTNIHLVFSCFLWSLFPSICQGQSREVAKLDQLNQTTRKQVRDNRSLAYKNSEKVLIATKNQVQLRPQRIDALCNKSLCFIHDSQPDSAEYYYQSALKLQPQSIQQKAWLSYIKASIYELLQDVKSAQMVYTQALDYLNQSDDWYLRSSVFNDIGRVYHTQRDLEMALKYYQASLDLCLSHNDQRRAATTYNNMAAVYRIQKEYGLAKQYYQRALKIRQEGGDSLGIANVFNNMGALAKAQKDYLSASEHYRYALQFYQDIGDLEGILIAQMNIGAVYSSMDNLDDAKDYYEQAQRTVAQIPRSPYARQLQKALAILYYKRSEVDTAFEYLFNYVVQTDKLVNQDALQFTRELEAKYQNEKNAKELAIEQAKSSQSKLKIKQQNRLRNWLIVGGLILLSFLGIILWLYLKQQEANLLLRAQKQAIEQRDKEKEVLLKEIHHRVKNNLQVISSLLNIQARKLKEPAAVKALKESRSRIKSIALLHQKLYMNDDLGNIDLAVYLREICESVYLAFGVDVQDFPLELNIDKCILSLDTAMSLGLIVSELITNCFKYAFEDKKGRIYLTLRELGPAQFELIVKDNGKGLPENFEIDKTHSYGLSLIKSLSKKLKGSFELLDEAGVSAKIKFSNL